MTLAPASPTLATPARDSTARSSAFPFFLVLAYLILEFGRPQTVLPILEHLHLPALVTVMIALALFFRGKIDLSDTQTRLYLLLLLLMTLHGPFVVNHYWALQVWKTLLLLFIAYLGMITFVDSPQRYWKLIQVWLGTHIYLAVTGIQKGGRGVGGFLGDENDFCMTLNMVIPFSYFLALSERKRGKKLFFYGLTLLFLSANIFTFSRGGFVGLVAVALYCWLRSPNRVLSALMVLAFSGFLLMIAPEKYWQEMKTIQRGTSDPTGEGRVYLWKYGWKMFLDHPIVGVGQGNFPYVFSYYEGSDRLHTASQAGRAAHSLYFTLLPELGLVGGFVFSAMVLLTFRDTTSFRRRKPREPGEGRDLRRTPWEARVRSLSLAIEASMIGYLVTGAFISVFYYPNFWLLMGLLLALKKTLAKAHEKAHAPSH